MTALGGAAGSGTESGSVLRSVLRGASSWSAGSPLRSTAQEARLHLELAVARADEDVATSDVRRRGWPFRRHVDHARTVPSGYDRHHTPGARHDVEADMVEVGARIEVESEKVGTNPRAGVVTAVEGSLVRVRWDDGHETSFVPTSGSLRVVTTHDPPR
jgi:hypothetical protein